MAQSSVLWRGSWTTRTRIASGLVLFAYVLLHFLNIGMGLLSPDWADSFQHTRQVITRSWAGTVVLYAALVAHAFLGVAHLATRRTLRMPVWEALQIVLGLLIPLVLAAHIVHTRVAHEIFDLQDRLGYIAGLIWNTSDGWLQGTLLLVVWVHACIGLHFWLRLTRWWRRAVPWLIGLAALVPAFALSGFMVEGRRIQAILNSGDADNAQGLVRDFNWPGLEEFATLKIISDWALWTTLGLFLLIVAVRAGLRLAETRRSVRISYVDGPQISTPPGPTLLEMSRMHGVPHTALCGGKGRCTTCRVVIEHGADRLPPPSEAEAASLAAVAADPGTRLACQLRPDTPLTVFRVFRPDGRRSRAHASQGEERQLALLFLDMRGFTARTNGLLPYDVVFLLNRFFDAIVPPIQASGGTVDKYLGDGLLAVFETRDSESSARAALQAVAGVGRALERFNAALDTEGATAVRIGMGLHLGMIVLGEIGAAGHAPRTLIGDTVNTASRLEGQTKELGVELLISASVLEAAGIETRDIDLVSLTLRGRDEPLEAVPLARASDAEDLLKMVAE